MIGRRALPAVFALAACARAFGQRGADAGQPRPS
jgi:hypothetical protein